MHTKYTLPTSNIDLDGSHTLHKLPLDLSQAWSERAALNELGNANT